MIVQTAERLDHVKEYYFSKKLAQIRGMKTNGREVINLGIGNPDLEPHPSVIRSAITNTSLKDVHGYQPYRGIPALRGAFSLWYAKQFAVSLSAENEVLPLMGSKEGVMHISMAFLNKGDGVLVPNPGYPAYEAASKMCSADVQHYNLKQDNDWFPDFEEIEKKDLSGVKVMWVNYPHMPTGKRPTEKLFQKLIEFGLRHNILIINDNPYGLILNDKPMSMLSGRDAKSVALEMNSLSKSHNMAGWRIGMVAGSKNHIDAILKVKSNMDSGMFLPLQLAGIKALELGQEWYENLNDTYKERKELVHHILQKLGSKYAEDQSGLFVWSSIPEGWTGDEQFSEHLLHEHKLFITPGSVFGTNGRGYIRTSLCVPEDKLRESLQRIS
jgi:aspartate/methionine/tyrosine aminotransferase